MAEWYYRSLNQEVGPINNKKLLSLVRAGEVTPETELRKGDDGKWVRAHKVNGLFESAGTNKVVQKVCPHCGHMVNNPPTKCRGCNRFVSMAMEEREETEEEREAYKERQRDQEIDDQASLTDQSRPIFDNLVLAFTITFMLSLIMLIVCVVGSYWNAVTITIFSLLVLSSLGCYIATRYVDEEDDSPENVI